MPSDASKFLRSMCRERNCTTLTHQGNTLTICMEPLTIAELSTIDARAKGNPFNQMIETFLMKATDADGNKLFTLEDKAELRRVDADLLAKVMKDLRVNGVQEDDENP